MTPCDIPSPTCSEAGWKAGDLFSVRTGVWGLCERGEIVQLIYDDGSNNPYFFSRTDNKVKSLFTDYVSKIREEKPTSEFSGVVWEGIHFEATCPEEYLEISEAINKLEVFRVEGP